MTTLRIAVTADLHFGQNPRGDAATHQLHDHLLREPPDLLLLGGDVGTDQHFGECLELLSDVPCRKALVPGNHDVWVADGDHRGDSQSVYDHYLPRVATAIDYHYLDGGPLVLPGHDLAVVGTMNWYDYSWSLDQLRERLPDWEDRLKTKRFSRGRHNDARFVRWSFDDVSFTAHAVAGFARDLELALGYAKHVLVLTHHPAFRGLNFPRQEVTDDGLLWEAFSGNAALEQLLEQHADRIPLVFSGHTHREREATLAGIRGFNVGGDYHFKRLLTIDWPAGTVRAHVFGDPERHRG
jgi:3',5'-cyclic AMP phosphodiesterase CpdA